MDPFSEDEETNDELLIITRSLPDIAIDDIVTQLWEVDALLRQRTAS